MYEYITIWGPVVVLILFLSGAVIHPDKTPHVRAPDAFDLLKKVRPQHFRTNAFIDYRRWCDFCRQNPSYPTRRND